MTQNKQRKVRGEVNATLGFCIAGAAIAQYGKFLLYDNKMCFALI